MVAWPTFINCPIKGSVQWPKHSPYHWGIENAIIIYGQKSKGITGPTLCVGRLFFFFFVFSSSPFLVVCGRAPLYTSFLI